MAKVIPLYRRMAQLIETIANCELRGADEWRAKHVERLLSLVKEHLPSGSGFDSGTTIDIDRSTPEKIIFETSFHHMDEHGGYAGWTDHRVTMRPSLASEFLLKVGGRDRNQIKDYIAESFYHALSAEVEQ